MLRHVSRSSVPTVVLWSLLAMAEPRFSRSTVEVVLEVAITPASGCVDVVSAISSAVCSPGMESIFHIIRQHPYLVDFPRSYAKDGSLAISTRGCR